MIRSEYVKTMSMSCSTWTTARMPTCRAAPTRVSMTRCLSAVLTPLVGSSRRMTSGARANAVATSRSFLSPWGRCFAGVSRRPASPNSSATASAWAVTSRSRSSAANHRRPRPSRETTAACSASSTVSSGKTWTSWKLRARPIRASRPGPSPPTSRPLKYTRPAVGRASPVRTLTSVVFPAPLGPMTETNWPASTPKLTPSRARKSP